MQFLPRRPSSSGGDSTIEMTSQQAHSFRGDEDTHKEVFAAPGDHYLGSPNNEIKPPLPENYPELAPHSGLEAVKPDNNPYGSGLYTKWNHDDSPIPVTATTAGGTTLAGGLPPTDTHNQPGLEAVPPKKPWYQNWTIRILIIAATIIIIVAIIVGAVVGSQNSGGGDDDSSPAEESETATATTTTSSPSATPTSDEPDSLRMGVSYNVTFTMYGTNDGSGGSNCNNNLNSCGFHANPGYHIGVSDNLFGEVGRVGSAPVCGTCWFLETFEDASGNELRHNITAIVNTSCSGEPGEVCGMEDLNDTNEWDGQVNINLCTDSGARDALFEEGSEVGLAIGRATRVDCDEWEGELRGRD